MLNISGLNEGIVLDHIQAGKSLDIYYHLGLDRLDCQVAIIKNARSSKMGKKDIIKIEGGNVLETLDLEILGYIDHNITVNIIHENKIVEKQRLKLPKSPMSFNVKIQGASLRLNKNFPMSFIFLTKRRRLIAVCIVMKSMNSYG